MKFNDDGRGLFEDETALIYCARAAVGWSARENRGSSGASGLGRDLMRAAAFLGRVRLGTGRAPPTLFEAVTLFSRPIAEWLRGLQCSSKRMRTRRRAQVASWKTPSTSCDMNLQRMAW